MTTSPTSYTSQDTDGSQSQVAVETHVEVELVGELGTREHLAFDVVLDDEADFSSGFLSAGAALAQAMLGEQAGKRGAVRH